MPTVPFNELMAAAQQGGYAVGYFESWNLESLLAVADAAETTRSPVILGFSGIYLPHPERAVRDPLSVYADLGRSVCQRISVPACLLFNESPNYDWVMNAIDTGFQLVMYSDAELDRQLLIERTQQVCRRAHQVRTAVEAEIEALPGVAGNIAASALNCAKVDNTDPDAAREFVQQTGIDALAINIGQAHFHGRQSVRLDFEQLQRIRDAVTVPLVLHGASSVERNDLSRAAGQGISKINVGSVLKQVYFETLGKACQQTAPDANPYESIGSGLPSDVLTVARVAMRAKVEELMRCFGSAGMA